MDDYFEEVKENLKKKIPEYSSTEFNKIRNQIINKLKREESDLLILTRRLKILVLGDWYAEENKRLLDDIKIKLLKAGLYAETIDNYYDIKKRGGLSPIQILEMCCINHQLIVFIEGEGSGTITEQNYLCENYIFHGKIIFFIELSKFDQIKGNPSEYIKDFPTIITYKKEDLLEKVLVYSRFRIYRLAGIIKKQASIRAGLYSPSYTPWKKRLNRKWKRK